jgi:hypothetical protein
MLALPKPGLSIVIDTDASAEQFGAVILQEESCEKGTLDLGPIAFRSRNFNAAELSYSPTEREALAVVGLSNLLAHMLS